MVLDLNDRVADEGVAGDSAAATATAPLVEEYELRSLLEVRFDRGEDSKCEVSKS